MFWVCLVVVLCWPPALLLLVQEVPGAIGLGTVAQHFSGQGSLTFLSGVAGLVALCMFIETVRVILVSIARRKEGARWIGLGYLTLILCWLAKVLSVGLLTLGLLPARHFSLLFSLLPNAGVMVFVTCTSVHLARNYARVYRDLRLALDENQSRNAELLAARAEAEHARQSAEEARCAADAANQAKSRFLAHMSHEVRTPLNAIIGYSEMLEETAEDLGTKDFIPDLQKIHGAGKHLLTLINDILDLAKVEAGKATLFLEEYDLAKMVQDVATTVQPLVAKNSNHLEVVCPPGIGTMRADLTKVRQTLFNLLSNAAKFTEHGVIRLSVARAPDASRETPCSAVNAQHPTLNRQPSTINFQVSDTGIGMTSEQMSRLFQAFGQAEASTARKFGGTGLGLVISRKFCQLMGGDLTARSEPGKGSIFTVTLPAEVRAAATEPGPHAEPATARPPASGPTVLVIEDDPAARDLARRVLAKEGYAVQCAASGAEGLELARRARPDAIALDVMMPGMDGWAVLTALKADPQLAPIPVIMITIVDDRNLGFALGAAEYFTKPIDWNRLTAVLRRLRGTGAGGHALVVEDEPATQELLQRNLERDGWSVALAANGRMAIEALAARPPEIILLDLLMPEMDGFEFLDELRRRPEWHRIPVAVITSKDLTAEDRRRLNGRVARIIQKGTLSLDELAATVRALVAGRPPPLPES